MGESKSELTDRLRREGRWDEFKKRREVLKTDGVPAKHAWFQAATEFPPLNDKPPNGTPKVDLQMFKGKAPISMIDAVAWAFEQLDCAWVLPQDAPSPGAWSLLDWARSNAATRSEFYRMFAARIFQLLQVREKRAEELRQKPPSRRAKVEELLDRLSKESRKESSNNFRRGAQASEC